MRITAVIRLGELDVGIRAHASKLLGKRLAGEPLRFQHVQAGWQRPMFLDRESAACSKLAHRVARGLRLHAARHASGSELDDDAR